MLKWYGNDAYPNYKTKSLMKILFGQQSKNLPNLYVPFNLDYLVTAINLPKSSFFSSYINIIEKMSVFPLYTYFMSDDFLGVDIDTTKLTLKLKHIECRREFDILFENFKRGVRCQYCKKLHNYRKKVQDVFEDEYMVLDYNTYLKEATYVHNKKSCMSKFKISPRRFIKIRYCPSCHSSKTYKDNKKIVYNHNK